MFGLSEFPQFSAFGEALYSALFQRNKDVGTAYFVTAATLDVFITMQMLLLLLRSKNSEYARTNSIIHKLVLLVISSNFVTAATTTSIVILVRSYVHR
jgi:hypothetical protein